MPESIPLADAPIVETPVVDDESQLDAEIDGTISKIKAVQTEVAYPPESAESPSEKSDAGAEAPPAEEAKPDNGPETEEPSFELREPVRVKFETEESFNTRVRLFNLVKQKKASQDPQEKEDIQKQMTEIRDSLRSLDRFTSPKDGNAPEVVQPSPAPTDNDSVVRKEDLPKILEEMRMETEAKVTIDSFFDKHPEFKDPAVREVFTDFFDSNYKLDGKNAKGISEVLELAHGAMFRQNESVQERVLQGADVMEKVNAMQFPGGTVVRTGLTPSQDASIKEMMAANPNMSEDRARELILD